MANKFVNLDSRLGKVRSRIYRCGVELEGGWDRLPTGYQWGSSNRDSSVHVQNGEFIGEIPSPILAPTDGLKDCLGMPTWMKKFYPPYIDASCGMHCHMSFRSMLQYQRLMDSSEFMWTVVEYLRRWAEKNLPAGHCFFDRLSGKSEYCQLKFHPDLQVQKVRKEFDHFGHGHRYTVLNFDKRKDTIECRVIPMMPNVKLAIEVIDHLFQIVSAYLVEVGKRESAVDYKIPFSESTPESSTLRLTV